MIKTNFCQIHFFPWATPKFGVFALALDKLFSAKTTESALFKVIRPKIFLGSQIQKNKPKINKKISSNTFFSSVFCPFGSRSYRFFSFCYLKISSASKICTFSTQKRLNQHFFKFTWPKMKSFHQVNCFS